MTDQSSTYSLTLVRLHWLIVLMLIVQFVSHWGMEAVGEAMETGAEASAFDYVLVNIHKFGGLLIIAVAAVRVLVRLNSDVPELPDEMADWQKLLAKLGHIGLYALIFIIPISGAATVWIYEGFGDIHETLFKLLLALTVLHVGAALWHHFIVKDNVLKRMMPFLAKGS